MISKIKSAFSDFSSYLLDRFMKVGKFLRLIDENNQMSITNIAVLVVIYKVGTAQNVDLYDAGIILIALLNYSYKRYIKFKEVKEIKPSSSVEDDIVEQVKEEIKGLKDKVGSLQVAVGLTRSNKR